MQSKYLYLQGMWECVDGCVDCTHVVGVQGSMHMCGYHESVAGVTQETEPQCRRAPITQALFKNSRVLAAFRKTLVITCCRN